MNTTNNGSQLRTFKLIDKEGYLRHHPANGHVLKKVKSDIFCGTIDTHGCLINDSIELGTDLITKSELKFFEELTNKVPPQASTAVPEQSESQLPYQHLLDDCKAVGGSLCFFEEGVVFLWEETEYTIRTPKDYDKLINAIKVLQSMQKVYNIDSSTNEGE